MTTENPSASPSTVAAVISNSKDMDPKSLSSVAEFFQRTGIFATIPPEFSLKDSHSDFFRRLLKVDLVDRGRVSCTFTAKAPSLNIYGGMHGGAVASVAEIISMACARTVVGKDSDIFLGELSNCYLSGVPHNAELRVDASVIRSGRNVTVVGVEFRIKDSDKLTYTCRSTFYNLPVASL